MVELPQGVVVEVRRGGHDALSQLAGDMSRLGISGHIRIERKPKDMMPRVSQIIIQDGVPKVAIHESDAIKMGLDALLEIENDATTIDALISLHELSKEEIERVVNLYPDATIFSDQQEDSKNHGQWWNQVKLQSRRWVRDNRLPEIEATVEAPEIIRQKSQAQLKRLEGENKKLNLGDVLLLDCDESELVFEICSAFAGHGRPILVITRKHPEILNREFDLPLSSCLWLSSKQEKGSISPEIDLLRKQIMNFLWANKQAIIAVDGLEYLASKSDDASIMQFIRDIADEARVEDHAILLSCDLSAFDPIMWHNLSREVEELPANIAQLWLLEGESLFEHPICLELSEEESSWIEQQLSLVSSRSGDFVEMSSGEYIGGSSIIHSEDVASAGKNLAQVVEQWNESDLEPAVDKELQKAFERALEDSQTELIESDDSIIDSAEATGIYRPESTDLAEINSPAPENIEVDRIEKPAQVVAEKAIKPRKAIRVKRRKVKKVKTDNPYAHMSKSSILAAAQNNAELGEIENYNKYVPTKVGIAGDLAGYTERQDLAFARTFKTKQEKLGNPWSQAGKQKAAKKILALPESDYKQVVHYNDNKGGTSSGKSPLSSSNLDVKTSSSKFARESASRTQNQISVEQHYRNWADENNSNEHKSTELFDDKGKPLNRVGGKENDDS